MQDPANWAEIWDWTQRDGTRFSKFSHPAASQLYQVRDPHIVPINWAMSAPTGAGGLEGWRVHGGGGWGGGGRGVGRTLKRH